jgi:TolA-binding protein
MGRWIATIVGVALAALAGYLVGKQAPTESLPLEQISTRGSESVTSELRALREDNRQLQQRLDQLTREQERLAQENEILRKQQTTDRLLGGSGGELPAHPPK